MSTLQQPSYADLELPTNCDNGRRSNAVSGGGGEGGQQLSDTIEIVCAAENNHLDGNSHEKERMESSVSEFAVEIVDLQGGAQLHLAKIERDCRICHLSMDAANHDSGFPIELGCSCKEDLAAAHKQCAEAWFKIKGDKTCEICGSVAHNVVGVPEAVHTETWNETSDAAAASAPSSQRRNFWQGHRFINFLLACMVFAFVISWLFHFNVPS